MEKIEVTQEHIDRGRIADPFGCAIAEASKDILAYDVSVTDLILIGKDYYKATPEVVRWFRAFDKDKQSVKPITVELVPYKFGEGCNSGKYYDKKKQPIIICGEARVAGVASARGGRKTMSKQM